MLTRVILRRCLMGLLLIVIGVFGIILSVMSITSGKAVGRRGNSAIPVLIFAVISVAAGIASIAVYFRSYRRLKIREPGLSDALLEFSEVQIDGRYFLFEDRMIDVYDPAVIYYNEVEALNTHEYYRRRGGRKYVLTIALMNGTLHKCIFWGGRFSILNSGQDASGQLYIELKHRCPYTV